MNFYSWLHQAALEKARAASAGHDISRFVAGYRSIVDLVLDALDELAVVLRIADASGDKLGDACFGDFGLVQDEVVDPSIASIDFNCRVANVKLNNLHLDIVARILIIVPFAAGIKVDVCVVLIAGIVGLSGGPVGVRAVLTRDADPGSFSKLVGMTNPRPVVGEVAVVGETFHKSVLGCTRNGYQVSLDSAHRS